MRICIFTQINFQKKAIKIDLVGYQKAKEIQFTQYKIKWSWVQDFITLLSAVHSLLN